MASFFTFLSCIVAICGITSSAEILLFKGVYSGPKSERDLRRHLFQNYDKLVRPVKNASDGMTVYAGVKPLNIRTLDEKEQIIVLETFTLMKWVDEYMKWDPERYGNITVLRVPSTEVWRPDVSLYTAPDAFNMFPVPNTNVLIYSNGEILWVPMFSIKSRCPVPKANKKMITCNIKLGSWTYSGPIMDIQLYEDHVDLSDFQDVNPSWKLAEFTQDRQDKYYPCCPESYPSLNFNITLKRRSESIIVHKGDATLQDVSNTDW